MIHQAKPNPQLLDQQIFSERLASAISAIGISRNLAAPQSRSLSGESRHCRTYRRFDPVAIDPRLCPDHQKIAMASAPRSRSSANFGSLSFMSFLRKKSRNRQDRPFRNTPRLFEIARRRLSASRSLTR
jgi:hypothetical protein